jgi:hypothetical protein
MTLFVLSRDRVAIGQLDRRANWKAVQLKTSLRDRNIAIPELFTIQ